MILALGLALTFERSPIVWSMWRLNPLSTLHYRRWSDEWVVFDVGSGQTHSMDTVSAVALMHCEGGWADLSRIASAVALDLELPATALIIPTLQAVLDQFTNLGLLEFSAA